MVPWIRVHKPGKNLSGCEVFPPGDWMEGMGHGMEPDAKSGDGTGIMEMDKDKPSWMEVSPQVPPGPQVMKKPLTGHESLPSLEVKHPNKGHQQNCQEDIFPFQEMGHLLVDFVSRRSLSVKGCKCVNQWW